MQPALVVSIHDVAPATQARVARMLEELAAIAVARTSLLVVPDYHRKGRSLGEPAFVEWLRGLEERGHEVVLHGYYHERARRAGESTREKIVTRLYTADEGEFYDLDYDSALRLMREGQDDFARHGFHPSGFIAPAWLLGPEAQRAAIDAGFRYTTSLRGVRDFASTREAISQSLVYSTRSDWRCALSLFWNRTLFRRLTRNPLMRLSLHPPDLAHPGVWRQIMRLATRALRDRSPMTYRGWLDAESVSSRQPSAVA